MAVVVVMAVFQIIIIIVYFHVEKEMKTGLHRFSYYHHDQQTFIQIECKIMMIIIIMVIQLDVWCENQVNWEFLFYKKKERKKPPQLCSCFGWILIFSLKFFILQWWYVLCVCMFVLMKFYYRQFFHLFVWTFVVVVKFFTHAWSLLL